MFRTHLMFLSVHLTVRVQSGLVLDSDSKFARPSIGLDLSQQALNDYNENEVRICNDKLKLFYS